MVILTPHNRTHAVRQKFDFVDMALFAMGGEERSYKYGWILDEESPIDPVHTADCTRRCVTRKPDAVTIGPTYGDFSA